MKCFLKNFILLILLISIISCSKKDGKKIGVQIELLSDTEVIYNVMNDYYKAYESKDVDMIINLYADQYDNSLYSKDYFNILFNTLNEVIFDITTKKVDIITEKEAKFQAGGNISLEFHTGKQIKDYNEIFYLIKSDNMWKIYKRL